MIAKGGGPGSEAYKMFGGGDSSSSGGGASSGGGGESADVEMSS